MNEAGATRGPYSNGVARRAQIVAAAAGVFARYGYRSGTLRQIALEVGVTPAALTRHFDNKEDLLTSVVTYWRQQTDLLIDPNAEGIEFFGQLRGLVRFHVDNRGYLELFLALSIEAVDTAHPAAAFIRERYAQTLARFSRHLRLAIAHGDARPMTDAEIDFECRSLIAYLDGIELQWLLNPAIDLVDNVDRHLDNAVASWGATS